MNPDRWLFTVQTPFSAEAFVNSSLVVGDVVMLVDTGIVGKSYDLIAARLHELGLSIKDLRLIINTHGHSDHVGNNGRFVRASGCLVAAHARAVPWIDDREVAAREIAGRYPDVIPYPDAIRREYQRLIEERPARVNMTLADGTSIRAADDVVFRVLELPGHTWGEIGLLEENERILLVGDVLVPLEANQLIIYEDADVFRATLRRLRQLLEEGVVASVVAGHRARLESAEAIRWIDDILAMIASIERWTLECIGAAQKPVPALEVCRYVAGHAKRNPDWRAMVTVGGELARLEQQGQLRVSDGLWQAV